MAGDEIVPYGFDEAQFRSAIGLAMRMGSPNQSADKATFRWDPVRTFNPQDPAHKPYFWTQVPTSDLTHPDVVLDEVAVEYIGAGRGAASSTSVGVFVPRRAILTILDTNRALVEGANWVLLHDIPWGIIEETVGALGPVDIYQMTLQR